LTPHPH